MPPLHHRLLLCAALYTGGMKYFAAIYDYKPQNPLVAQTRAQHREFIAALHAEGKIFGSGPFTDTFGGALIIFALSDDAQVADALKLTEEDPFVQAGVVTARSVREWNPVIK